MADQIVVYGTVWCSDCRRAKKFLEAHRIPYESVDVELDEQARVFVENVNNGMRILPTIVFTDGSILSEPSYVQLAEKLGI